MRHSCTLMATLVVAAFAVSPADAQPSRAGVAPTLQASVGFGTIHGTVSDTTGAALDGVLVSALGVTSAVALTDAGGRFSFGNLQPGPYLLRAHHAGFVASGRELVQVRPNSQLMRAIALRRLMPDGHDAKPDTLAAGVTGVGQPQPIPVSDFESASGGDHPHTPTAWRLRHLKRSVLRDSNGVAFGETVDTADQPGAWRPAAWFGWAVESSARLASFLSDVPFSGEFNLLTTGSFDNPQDLFSASRLPPGVAYLSIGAPAGHGAWAVRAALTGGEVSSWILAGSYAGRALQDHTLDIGMSYGAQEYEKANPRTIATIAGANRNAGAVHGFDSWLISPRVELSYGARYARYDYIERENMLSPQVGVSVSPLARTYVRASVSQRMLAPGAEEFLPPAAAGPWLPPERTFSPLVSDGLRAERVRNFEIALEREFDDTYVISVRRFYQESSDQLVTLFGVDGRAAANAGHYLVASGGAVDADGWGVRLSSPLVRRLRGSVDYSLTRARWSPSAETAIIGTIAPSAARTGVEAFHDVTTSLEAAIPETATRVLFVYKVNTAYARSNGELASPGFDGRFDVRVHQALPFVRLVSSEWEVLVAVRNLFREPVTGSSVYDELLVVRPPKRIVGGFLVRF